jgi:protein-tyrosine-phosphatase
MSNPWISPYLKLGLIALLIISLGLFFVISKMHYDKPLITFVCTGNTGRSVMAEYLAKYGTDFTEHGYRINSRGVNVRPREKKPEVNAIVTMKKIGIRIKKHRAKQLTAASTKKANLILTMTAAQKDEILKTIAPGASNVYMLSECANGTQTDIPDAYGKPLKIYEATRHQIQSYLDKILKQDGRCKKHQGAA